MSALQASRTLVKSPPELWAELSDIEALARHLGEFGEIRITKADPETRVEWEADRASGTVRLEPSGWGTRVVLTVETPEEPLPGVPVVPEPAEVEPEEVALAEVEPAATEVAAVEVEPAASEAAAGESTASDAASDPQSVPEPAPKLGFFARLFRRAPKAIPAELVPPEPAPEPEVVPEPEAVVPEPQPQPEPEPDRSFATIEWEVPPAKEEQAAPPPPPPPSAEEAHAVLTGVLDTLGAAHHRPFSRS